MRSRLVDAETGAHLWAETYDRSLTTGSFELQDDLTSRIVATVADSDGVLVRSMASAVCDRPIEDLALDELILRYRFLGLLPAGVADHPR